MRLAFALVAALLAMPVGAQTPDALSPPADPLDVRILRVVYSADGPVPAAVMRQTNAASEPAFLAVVPAAALGALATGSDLRPAIRMGASEATVVGLTFALKGLVQRPRPYRSLADVAARDRRHKSDAVLDPNSFPSGHASVSFALATSASLSYPEWYVVAPAMTWASLTALARVWHGVHYPSDIAAGAALGAATAVGVHLLLPDPSDVDDPATVPSTISLRIAL